MLVVTMAMMAMDDDSDGERKEFLYLVKARFIEINYERKVHISCWIQIVRRKIVLFEKREKILEFAVISMT